MIVLKLYKDFKFSWKWARKVLFFFLILLGFAVLFQKTHQTNYFPITEVKIAGAQHIDHQEIKQLLMPVVHKGFLDVDVEQIRDRLLQCSWTKDAYVRRIWPNEVAIKIIEKEPIAVWNESSLLSRNGEIFSPDKKSFPKDLMAFVGPQGEQIQMMESYNQIERLLKPLHFTIARLELEPSHVFHITFTNGINLQISDKDILTRLPHFVKVYPKIVGNRAAQVDYVDLRYVNGLVVRWKTIT